MSNAVRFFLGKVEVNRPEHTLNCDDTSISLQQKFIEVLCFMAEHQSELLTREAVFDHVWDGNYYVGEKALTNAIWHLRKAFKELDPDNEYIETVRKSGYRLTMKAEQKEESTQLFSSLPLVTKNIAVPFVLFISVLLAFLLWPTSTLQKEIYQPPELLTDYAGRELFPSVSNDGRFLVYSWRAMGNQTDLYIKDLNNPDLPHENLTRSTASESRSDWLFDSSKLFFQRKTQQRCEIVGLSLSDKSIKSYGECDTNRLNDVAVSPDGQLLAYTGVDPENVRSGLYLKQINSEKASKRIRCDLCELGRIEEIDFSDDSKRLVIASQLAEGMQNIFLYNLESKSEQVIVAGVPDIRGLAWVPGEDKIVYSAVEHGNRYGYELDLESGERVNLNIKGFSYPTFDDAQNLYYHDWTIDTAIMRLELDGEVQASPFPLIQSNYDFRYPDYSIVKDKVAFISNESGYDEVWIASLDDLARQQLTKLKLHAKSPVWSPDGKRIAFKAKTKTDNQLHVFDIETQSSMQINSGLNYHGKPRWSLDGKALYSSSVNQIYRIDVATGISTRVTSGSHATEVSPNELIVYRRKRGFWRVKLEGESSIEEPLVMGLELANNNGWHVTKKGIYYLKTRAHDYRLSFYDFNEKKDTDVIRVPTRSFSTSRGVSYVPDKKWLLFTGYDSPQVDIKVVRKVVN